MSQKIICPNHGCPLEDLPFPIPEKGEGTCPVSGARFGFEFQFDKEKLVMDKFGNVTKKVVLKITGND